MSRLEQLLEIHPQNELRFKGPFKEGVTSFMKLTNPTNEDIYFKIKTTAPKKYCVRPNSGLIRPKEKVEVAITLQSGLEPHENFKHKFMVQSVIARGDSNDSSTVWNVSHDKLMHSKLRCVFEMPNSGGDSDMDIDYMQARRVASSGISTITLKTDTKQDQDANQNNEKKRVGDAKASPATKGGKVETLSSDLFKASTEVVLMRESESKLRQENLQLKEEILWLRQEDSRHSFAPPQKSEQMMMPVLVVSIVVGLLGIIIGKFIM